MTEVTTDLPCLYNCPNKNLYIEINRKISLNSQRPPHVTVDPFSVNPPQCKHNQ